MEDSTKMHDCCETRWVSTFAEPVRSREDGPVLRNHLGTTQGSFRVQQGSTTVDTAKTLSHLAIHVVAGLEVIELV